MPQSRSSPARCRLKATSSSNKKHKAFADFTVFAPPEAGVGAGSIFILISEARAKDIRTQKASAQHGGQRRSGLETVEIAFFGNAENRIPLRKYQGLLK
jgi:hypothetical protein